MKKIIIGLLAIGLTFASAGNIGKHFDRNGRVVGGVVGDEFIFFYFDNEAGNKKDDEMGILSNIAKKQICTNESQRKVIEQMNMSVKFIYVSDKGVSIVNIDDCKDVEFKK